MEALMFNMGTALVEFYIRSSDNDVPAGVSVNYFIVENVDAAKDSVTITFSFNDQYGNTERITFTYTAMEVLAIMLDNRPRL
jgi:hypothetical protein